jgi:transcription termination/antitermination protein NusG
MEEHEQDQNDSTIEELEASPADEQVELDAQTEDDVDSTDMDEPAGEPEETDVEASVEDEADLDDDRRWYVIHSYSGYENKVKRNLLQRIDSMEMESQIFEVIVPTIEEMELHDGKRRTVSRRVFPGYILVQMIMNDDSWYVVRNTPGVTGFVGMGNKPTPLSPQEVSKIMQRIESDAPQIRATFTVGQQVRIVDGPFIEFVGSVDEVDEGRSKLKVLVSFFGRETPVELDYLQVEKV